MSHPTVPTVPTVPTCHTRSYRTAYAVRTGELPGVPA